MNEASNAAGVRSLAGTCGLVTGGAKRIGAAIVETLHAAGTDVAVHYRNSAADANTLCTRLNAVRADSARCFGADLIEPGAADSLIDDVVAWRGKLDILVNNASTFYPTPLGDVTEDVFTDLVGSNLKAPLFLSQAAADHLQRQAGNIVNIVDIHARRPLRDHMVYVSAKAGLEMLTRSLAKELAPAVRVNGIAPGAIAWPEDGMEETTQQNILERIPLGRTGAPADIAQAVLFLVREASYTTGQILAVDGGRSSGW